MILAIESTDVQPTTTPDGSERRVLAYGEGLMLVRFDFAAGASSWVHSHPHEQVGYVAAGEIDFVMQGKEPVRLHAGGSYYVPPNIQHNVITYAPTVLLDAFTPMRKDFIENT